MGVPVFQIITIYYFYIISTEKLYKSGVLNEKRCKINFRRINNNKYKYIIHMKILFDFERPEYITLCNQLVSRNPHLNYAKITAYLITFLYNDVLKKIEKLETDRLINTTKKQKMISDLAYIFSTTDTADENFIGRLNIVSLQCTILFTENCIDPIFEDGLNNSFDYYNVLKSDDWKKYEVMKNNLTKKESGSFSALYLDSKRNPYTTPRQTDELIYLITINDYLSIDEVISSFLDNFIMCGMSPSFIYADGRLLNPFEFCLHDITHGKNYNVLCFERLSLSKPDLLSFYKFCKINISDKKKLYSVKFMFFLLIHESLCDFFPTLESPQISKTTVLSSITTNSVLKFSRYLDENDLLLSIPKDYRDSDEKISQYLDLSTDVYLTQLEKWKKWKEWKVFSFFSGKKTKRTRKKSKGTKNKAHRQTKQRKQK